MLLTPQTQLQSGVPTVLASIAQCESGQQQFYDDGSLVTHVNTNGTYDIGFWQINSSWLPLTKKMGLDVINNPQDNIEFGIWLYNRDGTSDWNGSKGCWGTNET